MHNWSNHPFLSIIHLIIGGLIACAIGWYNQYPIIYSDLGTYLKFGFLNEVPIDRPLTYGWFIRHMSLAESLLLSMIAQSILVVSVLYLWFQTFVSIRPQLWYYVSIVVLTLSSSFSFQVSQLLPDAFTPLIFLCVTMLVFGSMGVWRTIYVSAMLCFSIATHSTHFIISLLLMAAIGMSQWTGLTSTLSIRKWSMTLVVVFVASLIIPFTNAILDDGFYLNKGSSVFLFEKLCDLGIAAPYLERACETETYALCPHVSELDGDFLWDPKSPLYKIGGWEVAHEELSELNRDMLKQPNILGQFVLAAIANTPRQMLKWQIERQQVHGENSSPYYPIRDRLGSSELIRFQNSKQNRGTLNVTKLNPFYNAIIWLSLLVMMAGVFYIPKSRPIANSMLWFLIANAAICATFSTVIDRYQSRIIWLIPLMAIWVISIWLDRWAVKSTTA